MIVCRQECRCFTLASRFIPGESLFYFRTSTFRFRKFCSTKRSIQLCKDGRRSYTYSSNNSPFADLSVRIVEKFVREREADKEALVKVGDQLPRQLSWESVRLKILRSPVQSRFAALIFKLNIKLIICQHSCFKPQSSKLQTLSFLMSRSHNCN